MRQCLYIDILIKLIENLVRILKIKDIIGLEEVNEKNEFECKEKLV
jgi:hypothetical protein